MEPLRKRLLAAILSLVALIFIGIAGYIVIEGWPFLQSVYMTIITLTTTGFTDFNVSGTGKVFTIILLIGGAAVFTYSLSTATAVIVEGDLSDVWRRKKMEKTIASLEGHYVVCGAGNTGIHVIDEILRMQEKFVVIERDKDRLGLLLENRRFLYVNGDATDDAVLKKAGVERANGLVAALSEDADNLFVVLSARGLNPKLRIVSAAVSECCTEKLKKAGADCVILPEHIGGLRMASLLLRPAVVGFLDIMLRQEESTRFGEATIHEGSELIGKTLGNAKVREKTGLIVLAIRKAIDGKFIYNPPPETRISSSDALIVIGDVHQMITLKHIAKDPS